jgi:putative membrane-bound dehydrogenase-like protein
MPSQPISFFFRQAHLTFLRVGVVALRQPRPRSADGTSPALAPLNAAPLVAGRQVPPLLAPQRCKKVRGALFRQRPKGPALFLGLFLSVSSLLAQDRPRINALFLGDQGHHRPSALFKELSPILSYRGITVDYTENLSDLNPAHLDRYDCLIVYANIDRIEPDQEKAILDFVEGGKGYVPIHCASYCFQNSDKLIALTGAQFQSHSTGVFRTRIAEPDHPIMKGFAGFESWDETYVHHRHNPQNRTVLSYRGDEPWTWVRTQGKGRVFYTAWGHDERTWTKPGFQELIERGVRWAAGREVFTYQPTPGKDAKPFQYQPAKIAFYPPSSRRGNDGVWNQMQLPLDAEESMKHMVVPYGFEVKLFAAEPDIRPPLTMAWDERGRLWLCESVDYPNDIKPYGEGNDTIRICEDTDGDGRADKFTVFADHLNIPTSLTFANGGIIVQQAPRTLFLKDTDGDDRADVRKVLFTGWSKGDTHAGPNNLQYGLDNWIWGMLGYAGFDGEVGGRPHQFSMGFYRFRPDGSKLEYIRSSNNNTWGLGFSEEGIVFGSTANGNPSMYMPIPNRYYEAVRGWSAQRVNGIAESARFQPITERIRQVDFHGQYTAAAGHALYTARAYPREYWNRIAFVNGPTGKLLGAFVLEAKGADFSSRNPFNLVASDDEWTAPIMAEVGPDGMVWFIDWYNYIVQHNPTPVGFRTGRGNAYETELRDKNHGRIYRIVYKQAKPAPRLNLAQASPRQLVATLRNDNLLWRKHAQRLLVERGQTDVRDALLALVRDRQTDAIGLNVGAIHALWTLQGLGLLDHPDRETRDAVVAALKHPSAGVRRNAVLVLPPSSASADALLASGVLNDPDAQVRLAALLALADAPSADKIGVAAFDFLRRPENANDRWLREAATSLAAKHDAGFLRAVLAGSEAKGRSNQSKKEPTQPEPVNLIANPSLEDLGNDAPKSWRRATYGGQAQFEVAEGVAHSGQRSVKITSDQGADAGWAQTVTVKPGTRYRLSAWIKTQDLKKGSGLGAQLNLHELQRVGKTGPINGTHDWTKVTSEFETGGQSSLVLNLLFGGWGRSTGEAWFDDVELIDLGPASGAPAPGSLPENVGQVVSIVTRHYAERAPVESVLPTLVSLHGADEDLVSFLLDGLVAGWPEGVRPALAEADQAALSALMKSLSTNQKERLLTLVKRWGLQDVFSQDTAAVVRETRSQLTAERLPDAKRVRAAQRLIGLDDNPAAIRQILDQINLLSPPELSVGLVNALASSRTKEVAELLRGKWNDFTPATRRAGISVMLRRPDWTLALLGGIQADAIPKSDLNASEWQLLKLSKDEQVAALANGLASRSSADRVQVLERLLPDLKLNGDLARGKEVFTLLCAQCHTVNGQGGHIGPELTGIGVRPAHDILAEIVDPNRSLESNFRLWTIDTKDDESLAGRLDGETKTSIELLDLTGQRHVIQRKDIKSMVGSNLSIMPVGLLDELPAQDVASLMAYITASGHAKN